MLHSYLVNESLTILVVDDDPISRALIQQCLDREGRYEIVLASDGQEAINLFHSCRPDIVVSDWMMPRVDGLAFLDYIQRHPEVIRPYFILLTVKWRAEHRVQGLDAGADDYLVKPFESDELMARIRAGARVLRLKKDLESTVNQLEEKATLLEEDLRSAQRAQQSLLPGRLPSQSGVRFEYTFLPCHFVSGDSLNVFRLSEDQLAFYMLDVCGHGVQAVMLSVSIHRILTPDMNLNTPLKRPTAEAPYFRVCSPAEVFEILNRETSYNAGDFFTFFYGVLNHRTRELQYSRAGHLPPFLLKAGGEARMLMEGGLPIGIREDAAWTEGRVALEPGDRLLVYSDGVVEMRGQDRAQLGVEGLMERAHTYRALDLRGFLDALEQDVRQFSAGRPLRDDFSLLALEMSSTE